MELRMSRKERDRLKVIEQIEKGQIRQLDGARLLRLSHRQVRRLQAAYRARGDGALVHGLRGRASGRRIGPAVEARAKAFLEQRYDGVGPVLASEHLAEQAGVAVSRETARRWQMELGQWRPLRQGPRHRKQRPRRACFGELVQMDTSPHAWLGPDGEPCVLITLIDDATGIKLGRFFAADTGEANMAMIAAWIERYGRPVALYTDWASHFRQPQGRGKRPALTQIQRALLELGIELICANSPQAKGRVERSHGTDQGRLVTELRLAGIRRMTAANCYHDEVYLPKVNGKFAVAPASAVDAHRPAAGYDLAAILCVQEQRTVQNDWTVSIDGRRWQIQADAAAGKLRPKARVTLERRRDGSLRLRWQGRYLAFNPAPSALAARLVEAARQERLEWEERWSGQEPQERAVDLTLHSPDDEQSNARSGKSRPRKPDDPTLDIPGHDRTFLLCEKPDISTLH